MFIVEHLPKVDNMENFAILILILKTIHTSFIALYILPTPEFKSKV